MRFRGRIAVRCALIVAASGVTWVARAQEGPAIRPEVDLLKQSVSEKLQSVAERLGLSQEQRDKIKETHRSFEARRQALRDQRRELHQSDLKSISDILTPNQRTQVDDLIDDRVDAQKADEGPVAWAEEALLHDSFAHKVRVAAEKLGLTPEQRYQIKERLAGSVEKYREHRRARRELVEAEFKAVAEVLSPEQREKAHRYLEHRLVTASIIQSVSERLQAAADKLGLTAEQRQRIIDTYRNYDDKYEKLCDDRRELLKSELKSAGEILTPDQREKVRNYFQDHVVLVDVQFPTRTTHKPRRCSKRQSRTGSTPPRTSWALPRISAQRSRPPTPPSPLRTPPSASSVKRSERRNSRRWARSSRPSNVRRPRTTSRTSWPIRNPLRREPVRTAG